MAIFKAITASAVALLSVHQAAAAPHAPKLSIRLPDIVEAGGMHNVHVEYLTMHDGELSLRYGPCSMRGADEAHHVVGTTHVGDHHLAKRHTAWEDQRPTRFVWLAPADIIDAGCLHAYSGDVLLGSSEPVRVAKRKTRRWLAASEIMDSTGPWFDGVAYLQEKEPDEVFVASTKSKKIGILGGGMAGLMTAVRDVRRTCHRAH